MRLHSLAFVACGVLLTGCSELQLGPSEERTMGLPAQFVETAVAEVRCAVSITAGTMTCDLPAPAGGSDSDGAAATIGMATVGGQHRFVRLVSTTYANDEVNNVITSDVTVQNLTLQPWATEDGATPKGAVRVFFTAGPTVTAGSGQVTVNADGTDAITAANQAYFRYEGTDLGDGILESGEISAAKTWSFGYDEAVGDFEFEVLVAAAVPDVSGLAVDLVQFSSGGSHACGVAASGEAYCWGGNIFGQIGDGTKTTRLLPTLVGEGIEFSKIAAGDNHTCALTPAGAAYCWGYNAFGQVGDGTDNAGVGGPSAADRENPTIVLGGHVFTDIFAGGAASCGLKANGEAWCWGLGTPGTLGNGASVSANTPVQVQGSGVAPLMFESLFLGLSHTCGIVTGGAAYCWGNGSSGQVGNNATGAFNTPQLVQGGHTFIAGAAGDNSTCAIDGSGDAYCWGAGTNGKLGNGLDASSRLVPAPVAMPVGVDFVSIAVDFHNACAVGDNGAVYCWGSDGVGELGNGSALTVDQWTPVPVDLGYVTFYGDNPSFTGITSGAQGRTLCAVTAAVRAYCWGNNGGKLGDGLTLGRDRPAWVAATQ
ncbi:MAG TPA: hypothetical protein VNZ57_00235 [Longimicrobiales bacterium]|nr:hypothetical protein [Longimicrobiales bacterium]